MASSQYDNVCRLCLGADDGGIIPIFCGSNDTDEGRDGLAGEIKACLSIQINEEDEFPKLICKICLEKVKNWCIFKSTCDEAQTKLRNSLKPCPREENPIDISFIKEEPITISEEEFLDESERIITSHFEPEITIKGEPKDIDENSSTIQIESITSNYEAPVEMLEVVPDLPQNYTNALQHISNNTGPPILASLGLAPKGTIMPRMMRTPVVNLTPLQLSDVYPMDTADSMDSAENSGSDSHTQNRRKLLNPKMNNCTICGLKFVSSGNARRHEKNVHKFYGLQPNPLNPEIIMNNSKSKSVMEPEILMEVDNDSVFQSVGENSDTEQYDSFTGRQQSLTPEEGTVLTEDNIAYIQRHKDILEQVHSRRCFCCNKGYSKLKPLLSHLRKKFVVPPFQCYNCLLSCSNRSDYVQHIRQRQCRNLYSLYKNLPQDIIENISKPLQMKVKKISAKIEKIPLKDALACKLFACNFCDLKNRLKAVIKKHLSTEHQEERDKPDNNLQCSYCHKEFEDSESKKRHYGNADCTSHVICELCGERFETLPPFNDHASSVHATSVTVRKISGMYEHSSSPIMTNRLSKSQVTKCKYCPKTYSSYHNMLRHLKNHHNEINPYKCEICKETFRVKNLLVAHQETCMKSGMNSQDEDDLQYNFSCKDCGVLFSTLEGWTKHQEVHQACEQCGATFQNIHELEMHRKEHLKVKFYNCNVCGNSYSQAEQLAEHMIEHGIMEKDASDCKWYCEICDRPFDNPLDYSTHMKIHNEMPLLSEGFNNGEVDKTKTAPKALVNGKRPWYKCSLCNKRVETKQGLHRHMTYRHKKQLAAMEGKKIGAYRCDLCPKRYANARGVLRHKKNSHPYARSQVNNVEMVEAPSLEPKFCNQCGLSGFQSQMELNKHRLATHYPRGAKVCNICNLITNDAKKMWYHKKKYHAIPGASNQCNICHKLFVTKPQFYAHIKNAHLKLPMEIEVTHSTKPVPKYREPQMVEFPEENENGPWNCDLCPKIFNSVNALKSHRGWHLRTADGKSATMVNKIAPVWIPDQMSPSRVIKRMKFSTSTPGTSQESKYVMPKFKVVPKLPAGAYCRICNKTFSKIAVYKRHVQEFHRPPKQSARPAEINPQELESIRKLHCVQCNETFQLKLDWIEHKVSHITQFVKEQNLPQWPCICGKLFSRKDNLKSHMKTHMHGIPESNTSAQSNNSTNAANKFYTCNPCRISFTTAKELKAHTDNHNHNGNVNVPKVLKCDFCGFMTEDIKLYQECRRAHHVPTKFKCEGCQIFFKNHSTLLKHHDEHHQNDGVEPPTSTSGFECGKCGKTYSMKHHLKRHIDSAH